MRGTRRLPRKSAADAAPGLDAAVSAAGPGLGRSAEPGPDALRQGSSSRSWPRGGCSSASTTGTRSWPWTSGRATSSGVSTPMARCGSRPRPARQGLLHQRRRPSVLRRRAGRPLQWRFAAVPSAQKVMGNRRVISAWPARGGPVVRDGSGLFRRQHLAVHGHVHLRPGRRERRGACG